jgi:hypothetical protein
MLISYTYMYFVHVEWCRLHPGSRGALQLEDLHKQMPVLIQIYRYTPQIMFKLQTRMPVPHQNWLTRK